MVLQHIPVAIGLSTPLQGVSGPVFPLFMKGIIVQVEKVFSFLWLAGKALRSLACHPVLCRSSSLFDLVSIWSLALRLGSLCTPQLLPSFYHSPPWATQAAFFLVCSLCILCVFQVSTSAFEPRPTACSSGLPTHPLPHLFPSRDP